MINTKKVPTTNKTMGHLGILCAGYVTLLLVAPQFNMIRHIALSHDPWLSTLVFGMLTYLVGLLEYAALAMAETALRRFDGE